MTSKNNKYKLINSAIYIVFGFLNGLLFGILFSVSSTHNWLIEYQSLFGTLATLFAGFLAYAGILITLDQNRQSEISQKKAIKESLIAEFETTIKALLSIRKTYLKKEIVDLYFIYLVARNIKYNKSLLSDFSIRSNLSYEENIYLSRFAEQINLISDEVDEIKDPQYEHFELRNNADINKISASLFNGTSVTLGMFEDFAPEHYKRFFKYIEKHGHCHIY